MKKLDDKVGYIRISQFQERTAEDLSKYLDELAKDGHLEGLVLDLRNDPGGLLQAAIGVSSRLPAEGLRRCFHEGTSGAVRLHLQGGRSRLPRGQRRQGALRPDACRKRRCPSSS